jgi:hypothetical protein
MKRTAVQRPLIQFIRSDATSVTPQRKRDHLPHHHRDFIGTRLLSPPHHAVRRFDLGFTSFSPDCFRTFNSAAARLLEFLFMGSERSNLPALGRLPIPASSLVRFSMSFLPLRAGWRESFRLPRI